MPLTLGSAEFAQPQETFDNKHIWPQIQGRTLTRKLLEITATIACLTKLMFLLAATGGIITRLFFFVILLLSNFTSVFFISDSKPDPRGRDCRKKSS